MSADIIYLNGEFLPKSEARLSIDERGFIFGDGVYEVTRAIGGKLFEWKQHAQRLSKSTKELKLDLHLSMEEIEKISLELLLRNGLSAGEAYIYVEVTRGAAPRAHAFPPKGTPCTVYMYAGTVASTEEKRRSGVAVITTPDIRWSRCDIKSVNLIPTVLAKQAAVEANCYEALFVREGVITEASHSNAFFVIDGYIRTYPASNYILPGVTRAVTLELAKLLQMKVSEAPVHVKDIAKLQECFLTGTNSDILPVVSIDGQKVGNGKPGPVTLRLYEQLAEKLYGKSGIRVA